jgi:hypothetical protein
MTTQDIRNSVKQLWHGPGDPAKIKRALDQSGGRCIVCDAFTPELCCSPECALRYEEILEEIESNGTSSL